MTAVHVIEQRDFGDPRGRIDVPRLVEADDPFCCPTRGELTSAS
jgi:hypothetical protein